MGEVQGGTKLGPKSEMKSPGLGFGQQNVGAFIFREREPYQGGVHRVLGHGGQQLGMARGWRGLVGAKKPKTESPELSFGRRNMGGLCFG